MSLDASASPLAPVRPAANPRAPGGPGSRSVYGLPFTLILAYFLVDYGRPQDWIPAIGLIKPGTLVLGTSAVVLLSSGRIRLPAVGRLILLFVCLLALSVPFADNRHWAFNKTFDFSVFLFGAVLPIIVFVDSAERLRALIGFFVWIHVPLALYSLTHRGVGVGSFLTDENDFALAMNIALPYAVALLILTRSALHRLLLLGAVALFLGAIVATMSRGGFLGLIAVGAVLWLRSRHKIRGLIGVAALALVFAIVARSQSDFGHHGEARSYWEEMSTIGTAAEEGDTGETRLELWGIAWRMFLDRPVFGFGPYNYGFRAADYETEYMRSHGRHAWGRMAHSLYFTLLAENGLVGTIVFGGIVLVGWRSRRSIESRCRQTVRGGTERSDEVEVARQLAQIAVATDAAVAAFLVCGAFISVLYYPHIWVLAAMSASLALSERDCRETCTAISQAPIRDGSPSTTAAS
jgi:O-antigen ligase